jgi:hypothetical protein
VTLRSVVLTVVVCGLKTLDVHLTMPPPIAEALASAGEDPNKLNFNHGDTVGVFHQ